MRIVSRVSYRISVCLIFIAVAAGCSAPEPEGFAAYPEMRAVFTDEEINDLEAIHAFFESQICNMLNMSADNPVACYTEFLQSTNASMSSGSIYVPVSYDAQLQLYDKLSKSAFTDIWLMGRGVDQATGDSVLRLNLSFEGKYVQFLDSLRVDYPGLTAYTNAMKADKMLSSQMIDNVLYASHTYDLTDRRMQLFLALHYLTINDIYERKNRE